MPMPMIETRLLAKRFPHRDERKRTAWKTAVEDLSLAVRAGEIFGLLGPNGAGKTTTIRMLTMQAQPTAGTILYDGRELRGHEREVKALIGVVPQHVNFDQDLTVGENMELHARLHHMGRQERQRRMAELLDYVGLRAAVHDPVRRLSGGMKRRLLIARALIHRPRILFLDEPTVALDPQVRRRIWGLVRQMAREGVTVFLTTHYIEEAESLCQRVAILNRGRLAALDTPQALCQSWGNFTVEWDRAEEREYRFFAARAEAAAFAATLPDEAGSVLVRPTNLEDVFVGLTGRKEGL